MSRIKYLYILILVALLFLTAYFFSSFFSRMKLKISEKEQSQKKTTLTEKADSPPEGKPIGTSDFAPQKAAFPDITGTAALTRVINGSRMEIVSVFCSSTSGSRLIIVKWRATNLSDKPLDYPWQDKYLEFMIRSENYEEIWIKSHAAPESGLEQRNIQPGEKTRLLWIRYNITEQMKDATAFKDLSWGGFDPALQALIYSFSIQCQKEGNSKFLATSR